MPTKKVQKLEVEAFPIDSLKICLKNFWNRTHRGEKFKERDHLGLKDFFPDEDSKNQRGTLQLFSPVQVLDKKNFPLSKFENILFHVFIFSSDKQCDDLFHCLLVERFHRRYQVKIWIRESWLTTFAYQLCRKCRSEATCHYWPSGWWRRKAESYSQCFSMTSIYLYINLRDFNL